MILREFLEEYKYRDFKAPEMAALRIFAEWLKERYELQPKSPPPLGINISDTINTKDKFG